MNSRTKRGLRYQLVAFVATTLSLCGCSGNPSGTNADSGADRSESTSAQTPADSETWLPSPDLDNSKLIAMYADAIILIDHDQLRGYPQLALASREVAKAAGSEGKTDLAVDYLIQAGKALRKAIEVEAPDLPPDSARADLFFGEAIAHSTRENVEEAIEVMGECVRLGSPPEVIETLSRNNQWQRVRDSEGYEQVEAAWFQSSAFRALSPALSRFRLAFEADDEQGVSRRLAEFKGQVVVLYLWGTWSEASRQLIPTLVELQESYSGKGVQLLAVNFEEGNDPQVKLAAMQNTVEQMGINFPCLVGGPNISRQIPDLKGFPTTIFIDKEGRVRRMASGVFDSKYLRAIVDVLLQE